MNNLKFKFWNADSFPSHQTWTKTSAPELNPILHREGGGGHKVPALISKIGIFATNTATAKKFGDFS